MSLLTGLCMVMLACGPSSPENTSATPPETVGPKPIEVTAGSEAFLYRYLSEDGTRVKTAGSVDSIPEACRHEVVILPSAPENSPPPGWDYVADLRKPLPLNVEAVQGFSIITRASAAPPKAPATSAQGSLPGTNPSAMQIPGIKEASNKRVSMFSSPGCGYCDKARNYFERKRVSFSEYDLERDGQRAQQKLMKLAKAAGVDPRTLSGVPIIFVGKHVVRGFDRRRLSQLLGI